MEKIIEKCKNTRILGLIGIICLILGMILPYYSISVLSYTLTISLIDYIEGRIVILISILELLLIFMDFVEKYIPSLFKSNIAQKIKGHDNPKYTLIPTAIMVILIIYLMTVSGFKYFSVGFYVTLVGVICLILYAFLYKKKDNLDINMDFNLDNVSNNNTNDNINNTNSDNSNNKKEI